MKKSLLPLFFLLASSYAVAHSLCDLSVADSLLSVEPLSVMQKPQAAASGDMHDYLSLARYFWPDTTAANGLPYVNRDGYSNPEILLYDRQALGLTAERISLLTQAWQQTHNPRYARKAAALLRVFFLNKATRMNPHLQYAQVARGHNHDQGRSYGIIDAYVLLPILRAVPVLQQSGVLSSKDAQAMQQWERDLLHWLLTSPQGIEECRVTNNHGLAYDAITGNLALVAGDDAACSQALQRAALRIPEQISADGLLANELSRTRSFHYSVYALNFCADLLELSYLADSSLSETALSRITLAAQRLASYAGRRLALWPYQNIDSSEVCQAELHDVLAKLDALGIPNLWPALALLEAEPQLRYAAIHMGDCRPRYDALDWRSGFFPGTLWLYSDFSDDPFFADAAARETWLIERAKHHSGTHDLGFMIGDSFGQAYRLTAATAYRNVVLTAARTLIQRFNPTVGCIRSWDHNPDRWQFPVIIDNMMNLEMLFEATRLTGDSTFHHIAVSHANTTLAHHFRPDASSFHVVDYDPATGAVRMQVTAQGYADSSVWARGQAWAAYGYTLCYRYTRCPRYLHQAQRIADYWLALPNMPADGIPYWDMALPDSLQNAPAPRDASAAAIFASALYELAQYTEEEAEDSAATNYPLDASAATNYLLDSAAATNYPLDSAAARYRAFADHSLQSLFRHYRAQTGSDGGYLLLHSTGHWPANREIDVPLNYADYYYIEALLRRFCALNSQF